MDIDTNKEIIKQLVKLKNIDRDTVVDILLDRVDTDYLIYVIEDLLNSDTINEVKGLWQEKTWVATMVS